MSDDEARREVGWIAREALALMKSTDSPRRQAYMDRKHALLAHIEARR